MKRCLCFSLIGQLLVLSLALLVAACGPTDAEIANGDDPVRALTVATQSSRYVEDYWVREYRDNRGQYERAVAYCRDKSIDAHPNCKAVLDAEAFVGAHVNSPRLEGKTYTGISRPPTADSTDTEK